ncbi:hypothetical protein B0I35DRAFT_485531 [Stachybotrys elegans]|uniref:Uncharacterized protein n=1 Tax=Stachybotrys elegans TaxID=80388 RepID=A0A8K0S7P5_9HYPO|nr:hypothetical protein B0I35DRAFT_485531 [Stachybotrys elegans]
MRGTVFEQVGADIKGNYKSIATSSKKEYEGVLWDGFLDTKGLAPVKDVRYVMRKALDVINSDMTREQMFEALTRFGQGHACDPERRGAQEVDGSREEDQPPAPSGLEREDAEHFDGHWREDNEREQEAGRGQDQERARWLADGDGHEQGLGMLFAYESIRLEERSSSPLVPGQARGRGLDHVSNGVRDIGLEFLDESVPLDRSVGVRTAWPVHVCNLQQALDLVRALVMSSYET